MGGFKTVARFSDGTVAVDGGTFPPPGLINVAKVAAGPNHALTLRTDGSVVAWGFGSYGETTVPLNLTRVTAIAAGRYHSVALKSDGYVDATRVNGAEFPLRRQSSVPRHLEGGHPADPQNKFLRPVVNPPAC